MSSEAQIVDGQPNWTLQKESNIFDRFPIEILDYILCDLKWEDIRQFRQTNKNNFIYGSWVCNKLQLIIQNTNNKTLPFIKSLAYFNQIDAIRALGAWYLINNDYKTWIYLSKYFSFNVHYRNNVDYRNNADYRKQFCVKSFKMGGVIRVLDAFEFNKYQIILYHYLYVCKHLHAIIYDVDTSRERKTLHSKDIELPLLDHIKNKLGINNIFYNPNTFCSEKNHQQIYKNICNDFFFQVYPEYWTTEIGDNYVITDKK